MTIRLSLTMIVKNEAATLARCLTSVRDLVDEIIVVDTGSSDGTRDIARQQGACVFDLPWPDSFAAARNESIRHATCHWLLWLDADEYLDEANRDKLRALLAHVPDDNSAYVMQQRSTTAAGSVTCADHVRLFRNDPAIRWDYRVHEQIPPSLTRAGHTMRATDILIEHSGYLEERRSGGKLERNLRLLQLDVADRPNDPFILFNLGWTLNDLGRMSEAIPVLQHALQQAPPSYFLIPRMHALLARCHRSLNQLAQAWSICQEGHARYPHDHELQFLSTLLKGQLCHERGDYAAARQCWTQLLEVRSPAVPAREGAFRSVDTGVCGPLARQHLAWLDYDEGRFVEAEHHWRTILAELPSCMPALLGLAELYGHQGRWPELAAILNEMQQQAPQQAASFRARMNQDRQEIAASAPQTLNTEDSVGLTQAQRAVFPFTVIVGVDVPD